MQMRTLLRMRVSEKTDAEIGGTKPIADRADLEMSDTA
jgi:hypothetical protein